MHVPISGIFTAQHCSTFVDVCLRALCSCDTRMGEDNLRSSVINRVPPRSRLYNLNCPNLLLRCAVLHIWQSNARSSFSWLPSMCRSLCVQHALPHAKVCQP